MYADPLLVLAHLALGNLVLRQGRLKESEKHFENTLALLAKYQQEDILLESEGLTVGRLRDLVALQRDQSRGTPESHRQATRVPDSPAVAKLKRASL